MPVPRSRILPSPPTARLLFTRWVLMVAPVVVILAVVALQAYRFSSINFRDDEIRTVHAALTMSPVQVVQWMSVDIHPPLWRVLATSWVRLFGVAESIARFSSTLTLALALAVFYRLMRDLFTGRVAVVAVLLLGMHALVLYYGHELRPYAALLLWTNLLHLAFVRWLRQPGLRNAVLYVLAGAAALYTHFFALYVVAAQVVALLVLVRPGGGRYARAFALIALTGLSFVGWLPSFLHSFLVTKPGGVDYGISEGSASLTQIYAVLQLQPSPLANLLQGLAVLMPLPVLARRAAADAPVFRFRASWPKWYWLIIAAAVMGAVLVTNRWVDVLTQRNLVVVVPALAALAALGLAALPWQAQLVGLALLLAPSVTHFPDYERLLPFREVASIIAPRYQADTPVILSVDNGPGDYFAFAYTLMDWLPGQIDQGDMLILTQGQSRINLPEPMRDPITAVSPQALDRLAALVADARTVWWVTSGYEPVYAAEFRALLERDFVRVESVPVPAGERYPEDYRVDLYQRRPGS